MKMTTGLRRRALGPLLAMTGALVAAACTASLAPDPEPPESEWAGVIVFRPSATLLGDTFQTRVWLVNWSPETLSLKTMSGCFFQSGHPALLDAAGATVARAFFGCTQAVTTRRIAPADSLQSGWALDVRGVPDGAYTLRFRFAVVEVNDVAAELPDVELPVNIRR